MATVLLLVLFASLPLRGGFAHACRFTYVVVAFCMRGWHSFFLPWAQVALALYPCHCAAARHVFEMALTRPCGVACACMRHVSLPLHRVRRPCHGMQKEELLFPAIVRRLMPLP